MVVRARKSADSLCFVYAALLSVCLFAADTLTCSAEKAARRFTLVIDAGHGGHDAGATGTYSKEKNINLNVALAFGRLVEDNCPDVKVVYTRRTDVFIPLQRRADIANDNKADLFISIHTNALPGGKIAYGSETYTLGMASANENLSVAKRENSVITLESDYKRTYQGFDPNKAESYVIFEIMQDKYMTRSVELAKQIQKQYKAAGRPNKGVHQAGFLVLRNTSMPSVLTELGFITTPAEETYLNSKQGINELSRSIYNGFLAYRRLYDKTTRSVPADVQNRDTDDKPQNFSTRPLAEHDTDDVAVVPVQVTPTAQLHASQRAESEERASERSVTARQNDRQANTARESKADNKPSAKRNNTAQQQKKETAQKGKADNKKETADPKNGKNNPKKGNNGPKNEKADKPEKTSDARNAKDNGKTDSRDKKQQNGDAKSSKQKAASTQRIKYRIQVGAGKIELPVTDRQFKGLSVQRVKEGTLYKYFYGTYTTYADVQKAYKGVKEKIPAAYIVAYVGGKSVSVAEARAKEKEK